MATSAVFARNNSTSGNAASTNVATYNQTMFRNKIMNGHFIVDQRATDTTAVSVTTTTGTYGPDRWFGATTAGAFTIEQIAVPGTLVGFAKCMKVAVTTAVASPAASAYATFGQRIEGQNIADFGFGASGAFSCTLSFWIYSSVAGTMGLRLGNAAGASPTRVLTSTVTIAAATTWQYIIATFTGDTTGTWAKDNTCGLQVEWTLMAGTTYQTSSLNAWSATNAYSSSSQTNIMGTVGNTVYITGVQLERGSLATMYDFRPYVVEIQLCQRYYETGFSAFCWNANSAATDAKTYAVFKITKRIIPSISATAASGALLAPVSTVIMLDGTLLRFNSTSTGNISASWIANSEL